MSCFSVVFFFGLPGVCLVSVLCLSCVCLVSVLCLYYFCLVSVLCLYFFSCAFFCCVYVLYLYFCPFLYCVMYMFGVCFASVFMCMSSVCNVYFVQCPSFCILYVLRLVSNLCIFSVHFCVFCVNFGSSLCIMHSTPPDGKKLEVCSEETCRYSSHCYKSTYVTDQCCAMCE